LKDYEDLRFRKATMDDLGTITALEDRCFCPVDRFSAAAFRRYIRNKNGSVYVDIIEFAGEPVGYAVYFTRTNSKVIRLYAFCISPDFTGRGLGRQYLEMRLPTFTGYSVASLEVRAGNSRAIALYEKLGFVIRQRLPGYYGDGEDGFRMVKVLQP
jgi:ribosomal-protein-alanine N-acetyltransferase